MPLNTTAEEGLPNWIRLNPTLARYGYGYKWHGSRTTQFGISVLLVHMLMAIAHTAFVFYRVLLRGEGIGNAFDTIGEIVALALNSSGSEKLQNTCGGIKDTETWRQVVAVRETYHGHLEMVVGNEAKERAVKAAPEVRYGRMKVD